MRCGADDPRKTFVIDVHHISLRKRLLEAKSVHHRYPLRPLPSHHHIHNELLQFSLLAGKSAEGSGSGTSSSALSTNAFSIKASWSVSQPLDKSEQHALLHTDAFCAPKLPASSHQGLFYHSASISPHVPQSRLTTSPVEVAGARTVIA